jgi:predicted metal-dependent hydrolase
MANKKIVLPLIGDVLLYKYRSSRSIRIKVTGSNSVKVTLPYWAPYNSAIKFVNTRIDWIASQQLRFGVLADKQSIGKAHHLRFISGQPVHSVRARLNQTEIIVTVPTAMGNDDPSVQAAARRSCIRALQQEAQALLPQRLKALAQQHGFSYRSVHTRNLKSRWGSCNQENYIGLNIFLMQLPWKLIDYVLLHELVHTRVHNHSAEFWNELEKHSPGARQLRRETNSYHPDFK